jgi:preprotein translocase subunit SecA
MEHLENMDHLREGIHWMSVGQQDPLVEYRRRGQQLFEEMQLKLRHDVLQVLFHAEPVAEDQLRGPVETELTRAARSSVSNANRITDSEQEFAASDFRSENNDSVASAVKDVEKRKKARKAERKRKTVAKRRKK